MRAGAQRLKDTTQKGDLRILLCSCKAWQGLRPLALDRWFWLRVRTVWYTPTRASSPLLRQYPRLPGLQDKPLLFHVSRAAHRRCAKAACFTGEDLRFIFSPRFAWPMYLQSTLIASIPPSCAPQDEMASARAPLNWRTSEKSVFCGRSFLSCEPAAYFAHLLLHWVMMRGVRSRTDLNKPYPLAPASAYLKSFR